MLTSPMRLAIPLVLVVATMGVAGGPASADSDRPAERPVVTAAGEPAVVGIRGAGRMDYPKEDDEVRIFVDARGVLLGHDDDATDDEGEGRPAARSWGTFRIQHLVPQTDGRPPLFNWVDFKVDCLRVDGSEVAVTGRIVEAGPYWQEFLERKPTARMGLGFHIPAEGDGPARVSIIPPAAAGQPEVPKCSIKTPDAEVIEGGYSVMDSRR